MPVPTVITDLSTTISSNSPVGGDVPSVLDDHLRAHAGFIAQLRDGTGFTGSLSAPTSYRIGGATQGAFGRRVSTGSGATASTSFDDVVIDATGADVGISLLTDSTRTCALVFGDGASATVGRLQYAHATDTASIWAAGAQRVAVSSTGMSVTGKITAVTEGAGSGQAPNSNYDNIVIDSENNAGLSILTGATSVGGVRFGRLGSATVGGMDYANATDTLTLVAGSTTALSVTSTEVDSVVPVRSSSTAGAIGYKAGAGSSFTQTTSLTNAVTVTGGRPTWKITTFSGANYGIGTTTQFTVNNTLITADTIVVAQYDNQLDATFRVYISAVTSGSCVVRVENLSGLSLPGGQTIKFALLNVSGS